jgi:hypothetical protein
MTIGLGQLMKEIPLSQGKVSYVDEDFEYLNQWKWSVLKSDKGGRELFYAYRMDYTGDKPVPVMMHRLITKTPDGEQPDHQDHNGLNNQKYNLRNCAHKQNQGNQRYCLNKVSKYKGVSFFKGRNRPWFAQITVEGMRYHKGGFDEEIEAALWYDSMAKKLFGEFAYLNFPDSRRVSYV